jgi:hypothetical protein
MGEEQRKSQTQAESHPTSVQFPKFPAPNQSLWSIRMNCSTGNEQETDSGNYERWSRQGDSIERSGRDLRGNEGIRDAEIEK